MAMCKPCGQSRRLRRILRSVRARDIDVRPAVRRPAMEEAREGLTQWIEEGDSQLLIPLLIALLIDPNPTPNPAPDRAPVSLRDYGAGLGAGLGVGTWKIQKIQGLSLDSPSLDSPSILSWSHARFIWRPRASGATRLRHLVPNHGPFHQKTEPQAVPLRGESLLMPDPSGGIAPAARL